MEPAQRAAAKALAAWREQRAMKHDKPRGWILHDETLRALAETLPATAAELGAVRGMPPGVARKQAEELLGLIAESRQQAGNEPPAQRTARPEPEQMARIQRVSARVREIGEQLALSPELLATRRDVEQLVLNGEPGVFMKGWRQTVLGNEVVSLAS